MQHHGLSEIESTHTHTHLELLNERVCVHKNDNSKHIEQRKPIHALEKTITAPTTSSTTPSHSPPRFGLPGAPSASPRRRRGSRRTRRVSASAPPPPWGTDQPLEGLAIEKRGMLANQPSKKKKSQSCLRGWDMLVQGHHQTITLTKAAMIPPAVIKPTWPLAEIMVCGRRWW